MEVLENHKDEFGTNFQDNKKKIDQFTIIRSKGLKNEIVGYITKFLKHELIDKQKQEERIAKHTKINEVSQENTYADKQRIGKAPTESPSTEKS